MSQPTRRYHLRLLAPAAMLLLAALAGHVALPRAQAAASAAPTPATVAYKAGFNLIAAPPGTDLTAVSGPLYRYAPAADGYQSVVATAIASGAGYWAYFPEDTEVTLAEGLDDPATAGPAVNGFGFGESPAAGKWVMVGNPAAHTSATVYGADRVYTYDPARGYTLTTKLTPGQGAWAHSTGGKRIYAAPDNLPPPAVAASPTPAPAANSAPAAGMKTISSPAGYKIEVPADWTGAAPTAQHPDLEVRGPNGPLLFVEGLGALPAGATASDTCNAANAALGQILTGGRPSPPQPTTVAGADSAASCAFDANLLGLGVTHIQQLVAVRGRQQFHVALWTTPDYLAANQGLVNQILASFQLTAPTP